MEKGKQGSHDSILSYTYTLNEILKSIFLDEDYRLIIVETVHILVISIAQLIMQQNLVIFPRGISMVRVDKLMRY